MWTITYLGVEQSAADWGLNAQPRIRTRDRSPTTFSFRMAGAAPESAIPFPFKAKVVIKQNRTLTGGSWTGAGLVFEGYQTTQRGRVDGHGQGVMLDFQDAIWLMQNTTFQQLWKQNADDGSGGVITTTIPESRVALFMDIAAYNAAPGTLQSMQWELNEIINYAASCGIAIQVGNTGDLAGWYMNYYQVSAVTCWDAILKCLEPVPDAKAWVDASTSPPSLHVRTRSNIAALAAPAATAPGPITLPYKGSDSAGRKHFSSELTPRYDLIPPQVVIQYQKNNTVNGKPAPVWTSDVYPPGSNGQTPFAMVVPIDLAGASITISTGQLDCEPLACVGAAHADKRAWWASKRGGEQAKLADFRIRFQDGTGALAPIADATITDDTGAPINLANYPNRHITGTYHAWMKNGNTQINAIRAHIKVKATSVQYDVPGSTPAETDTNGNAVGKSSAHDLHCHVVLTNSPAGVKPYSNYTAEGGETAAIGLAQNIFNSRATLDYDGTHEIVDPGITGSTIPLAQIIGHWNVLNLSGGDAAWAAANMTIAGTDIDLMTNHQTITVGPAKHLAPQDWKNLLYFFRNRRFSFFSESRATGYGGAGQQVDMARNTPDANTVAGLIVPSQHTAIEYLTPGDPTTAVAAKIEVDAAPPAVPDPGGSPARTISLKTANLDGADTKDMRARIWSLPVGGVMKNVAVMSTDVPDSFIC